MSLYLLYPPSLEFFPFSMNFLSWCNNSVLMWNPKHRKRRANALISNNPLINVLLNTPASEPSGFWLGLVMGCGGHHLKGGTLEGTGSSLSGLSRLTLRLFLTDTECWGDSWEKPAGSHVHLRSLAKSQKGKERKELFKDLHTTVERACAVTDNLPQ